MKSWIEPIELKSLKLIDWLKRLRFFLSAEHVKYGSQNSCKSIEPCFGLVPVPCFHNSMTQSLLENTSIVIIRYSRRFFLRTDGTPFVWNFWRHSPDFSFSLRLASCTVFNLWYHQLYSAPLRGFAGKAKLFRDALKENVFSSINKMYKDNGVNLAFVAGELKASIFQHVRIRGCCCDI